MTQYPNGAPLYPTKGLELVVPSNAEIAVTGWQVGIRFSRRGKDYAVDFHRSGLGITCNGAQVQSWNDLPQNVQTIIRQAKANYAHSIV